MFPPLTDLLRTLAMAQARVHPAVRSKFRCFYSWLLRFHCEDCNIYLTFSIHLAQGECEIPLRLFMVILVVRSSLET